MDDTSVATAWAELLAVCANEHGAPAFAWHLAERGSIPANIRAMATTWRRENLEPPEFAAELDLFADRVANMSGTSGAAFTVRAPTVQHRCGDLEDLDTPENTIQLAITAKENEELQLGEFTLDEPAARAWLEKVIAINDAECSGEDPPEYPELASDDMVPDDITSRWDPVWRDDNGTSVYELVRTAQTVGVLKAPPGCEVDFSFEDDSDGGAYRFIVYVRRGQPGEQPGGAASMRLTTGLEETRKLGEREAIGIRQALAVLQEAVWGGNACLQDLTGTVAMITEERGERK